MEGEITSGLIADAVALDRMEDRKDTPSKSERLSNKSDETKKNKRKRIEIEQQIHQGDPAADNDEETEDLHMKPRSGNSDEENKSGNAGAKKTAFKWTAKDEIKILEVLIKFKEEGKSVERVPNEVYEVMKSSLNDSVSTFQIKDKILKMRKKFRKAADSGFEELRVFELMSKLWGEADTNISSSSGVSMLPSFNELFKGQPNTTTTQGYERLSDDRKAMLEKKAAQIERKLQKLQTQSTQLFKETFESIMAASRSTSSQ